jgi:hypothetical protein
MNTAMGLLIEQNLGHFKWIRIVREKCKGRQFPGMEKEKWRNLSVVALLCTATEARRWVNKR